MPHLFLSIWDTSCPLKPKSSSLIIYRFFLFFFALWAFREKVNIYSTKISTFRWNVITYSLSVMAIFSISCSEEENGVTFRRVMYYSLCSSGAVCYFNFSPWLLFAPDLFCYTCPHTANISDERWRQLNFRTKTKGMKAPKKIDLKKNVSTWTNSN